MAYNNEAKRIFNWYGHQLLRAIKHYLNDGLPTKTLYTLREMIDDMPDGEDNEQLIRVLNCKECCSVKADMYGNARYIIPISYFAKDGVVNEKSVLHMARGIFKKYKGRNGEYLVTTASSRYELLVKVIMVLGRE